jgi:hypothetical protein
MGEPRPPVVDGVFNDNAGLWARRCGGGFCEPKEEFLDIEGLVEGWEGGSLRCLSAPANPFCLVRNGERSRPLGGATFLKVMVHSMSSPANTVESFHCTNTRMFEVMVGSGFGGHGRPAADLLCDIANARHPGPWSVRDRRVVR